MATSACGGAGRCERSGPQDSGSVGRSGAVVLDCRPPLLPVSMDIRGVDLLAGRLPAVSASMDVFFPRREGVTGINLSGVWCGSIGGPWY